jgi:uncharacterized membrane protein (DUF373 family)
VIALIKNRGEQLELGRLGSVSQLGFGLALMALGVVYYFVAGRSQNAVQETGIAEAVREQGTSEDSLR